MPFRHDLMLTSGNYSRLADIATARGVDREDILREALRAYLADTSLFQQSIPLPVDGANTYINCNLPADLREELNTAAQQHRVKPFGHQDHRTVFTRAVQHYFNQLARASAPAANVTLAPPVAFTTHYDRWRKEFVSHSPKFRL